MQPCIQSNAETAPEIEVKTKVVPTHQIDLVTTYFRNGEAIRQESETIGKLYGTETEVVVTRPGLRASTIAAIADRTLDNNQEQLDAGGDAAMVTRGGRVVGFVRPIQKEREPEMAELAAAFTAQPFQDLIPPKNETLLPLEGPAAIGAAIAGVIEALTTETPEARAEKERAEREELDAARQTLIQKKSEVEARMAAIDPDHSLAKAALGAEAALLGGASGALSAETIQSAIAQASALEVPLTTGDADKEFAKPLEGTKFASLAESYQSDGAIGTFKHLALEAAAATTPSAEALATLDFLRNSDFGRSIIAQVSEDIYLLLNEHTTEELPAREHIGESDKETPFRHYAEIPLATLTFSPILNDYRAGAAQNELALAA